METSPLPPFNEESLPQPEHVDKPALIKSKEVRPTEEFTIQEADLVTHAVEKEAVLPHVMASAEKDKPQEAVYELRHEIKDDKTVTPMIPIAQVVADIPKRQPAMAGMSATVSNGTDSGPDLPSHDSWINNPTNKKSIIVGFGGAVVILVIICLSYLIFS